MLTYAKLAKTPTKFQRFTGLTVQEFDKLAALLWNQCGKQQSESAEARRTRQRVMGVAEGSIS